MDKWTLYQRDLEEQIAEEKSVEALWCIKTHVVGFYDKKYNYYTKGKLYEVLGENREGDSILIYCDTGQKAWATKSYFSSIKPKMDTVEEGVTGPPKVTVGEILSLLKAGYTRYSRDDKGYGSIQKKYNLSIAQTKRLMDNPAFKQKKTTTPGVVLVDEKAQGKRMIDTLVDALGKTTGDSAGEIVGKVNKEQEDLFA